MSETLPDPVRPGSSTPRRAERQRTRKVRAILAGGLVFGVGASITLASWTDTEYSSADFSAGVFEIEIATSSSEGAWGSSNTMEFEAGSMYPGAVAYAPVFVRTTGASTFDAHLQVTGENAQGEANGIASALRYRAISTTIDNADMPSYSCSEAVFTGSAQYVFGSATESVAMVEHPEDSPPPVTAVPLGKVAAYCFQVLLPADTPNSAQGTGASHTWTWSAQSVIPEGER